MRLSRKAGLYARGIRWLKYQCVIEKVFTGDYDWYQTGMRHESSGGNAADIHLRFWGYTDYSIQWDGDQYIYVPAGEQKAVTAEQPGTVYEIEGTTLYIDNVNQYGSYYVYSRELITEPVYEDEYLIGDLISQVRAKKDTYPDEKNGYTYVTEYDGYTIMKDGKGKFYAYEIAPRAEPAKFTARIQDDVLVVRGTGVATVENGILYVR